ncbi:MAG: YqgE/AlgH family protein [Acidimicrobiia bacterium]
MAHESLKGRLLLAAPTLLDPNFFRTVVLVLEHSREGAVGLVLNRATDVQVVDTVADWSPLAAEPGVVFVGGPVSPDGAIGLARAPQPEEVDGWSPILPDLGTVDLGRAPSELGVAFETVRVFVGYSGWGEGQLDGELEVGGWLVLDAVPDDVFTASPEDLWKRVLKRQGGTTAWLANSPVEPSLN